MNLKVRLYILIILSCSKEVLYRAGLWGSWICTSQTFLLVVHDEIISSIHVKSHENIRSKFDVCQANVMFWILQLLSCRTLPRYFLGFKIYNLQVQDGSDWQIYFKLCTKPQTSESWLSFPPYVLRVKKMPLIAREVQ